MKLFTIGDSISQGFMSAAAARTDLSYSTLIAEALGLRRGRTYRYPGWPLGGHPVDLERLLRRLQHTYGNDIFGPFEWARAGLTIAGFLDDVEDYYERGEGSETSSYPGNVSHFHNIAVRGFDVADAWMVTPRLCLERIETDNRETWIDDGPLATPNESFYRTAFRVLNPTASRSNANLGRSALGWLERHARSQGVGGVENLILWLGANNALGTVLDLRIERTPEDPAAMPTTQPQREPYNLWHPAVFEAEYRELLDRVHKIMLRNQAPDWRVFVGTVPAVTIAPLAKGLPSGQPIAVDDPFGRLPTACYYKYYTYFPLDEYFGNYTAARLTLDQALEIDSTIAEYNRIIATVLTEKNQQLGQKRYWTVDICGALLDLAYKRNGGQPTYQLPAELQALSPTPNTKYYHADRRGNIIQGGFFSLDGVHPSAICQGLIARDFMRVMGDAGVTFARNLDWRRIVNSDHLWRNPLRIMQEVYEHQHLAFTLIELMRRMRRKSS